MFYRYTGNDAEDQHSFERLCKFIVSLTESHKKMKLKVMEMLRKNSGTSFVNVWKDILKHID